MEGHKSKTREYLEAILIAVIFLKFANTFVLQTFFIPSGSMEDTLLVGDHLFVNRFIFGQEGWFKGFPLLPSREIRRGDIVIFRSVEDPTQDLVKRCVGLPGDEIRVEAKQLYLNGKRVEDSAYAIHRDANVYPNVPQLRRDFRLRDNFGPFVVPKGRYFCMGDNRDNCHDSRFWEEAEHSVPASYIKGRAFVIYWSFGGGTSDGRWRGVGDFAVRIGKTALGFFTETRWSRTLQLIR